MFKTLLLFICFAAAVKVKALCPNGSVPWHTDCYFFQHNNTAIFPDADSACIDLGGHLASVHNAFTNAFLTKNVPNMFHGSSVSDFWIGYTNVMNWKDWTWMDGSNSDYTDWAPGQQSNFTNGNCAAVRLIDGSWKADDCFKRKPYVCKVKKSFYDVTTTTTMPPTTTTTKKFPTCPWPFIYFEPTHSCYGVGNWTNSVNWTQAEQYCQAFGAHSASIHSIEELNFIGCRFSKNESFRDIISSFSAPMWNR
uniref:C-type lectin domain-containing protein n=1 Tax=Panagrolaimus superbus TaxID=310955 RepID=A0A914Y2A9_9BILA